MATFLLLQPLGLHAVFGHLKLPITWVSYSRRASWSLTRLRTQVQVMLWDTAAATSLWRDGNMKNGLVSSLGAGLGFFAILVILG